MFRKPENVPKIFLRLVQKDAIQFQQQSWTQLYYCTELEVKPMFYTLHSALYAKMISVNLLAKKQFVKWWCNWNSNSEILLSFCSINSSRWNSNRFSLSLVFHCFRFMLNGYVLRNSYFVLTLFRFSLLSLTVCNIWNSCIYYEMAKLNSKKRKKIYMATRKKVWYDWIQMFYFKTWVKQCSRLRWIKGWFISMLSCSLYQSAK